MSESERERRQRQEAQRLLRAVMPDVTRVMEQIRKSQFNIPDIGKLYTDPYRELIAGLQLNLPKIQVITPDLSKYLAQSVTIPNLRLDYPSLFPDFAAVHKAAIGQILPSAALIQDLQRNQFADIIRQAKRALEARLPPNWRSDKISVPADLEAMLLDEGLALAWVPPAHIVARLFRAKTAQERRRVIGAAWRPITQACIQELEGIENSEVGEHVEFALDAGRTLLVGQHRAAQALSASLLDTILRANFDNKDRVTITGQKTRMDIDQYPLRVAIVLGGIWGAFGEFWASKGDKVPRKFSRHGSVHGVSRRQYSRINSVLALMHVVSLLRLLEHDLAKP
jgi:hypothetical protein